MDKPKQVKKKKGKKPFPPRPEKDILLFIEEHSRELEPWQRDILTMMREEMLYFWPQLETKIMNEGWASYWHQRIIRELDLTSDEAIEFAKLNAGVVQPSKTGINPYYLGLKIFEDIEERYDSLFSFSPASAYPFPINHRKAMARFLLRPPLRHRRSTAASA